MRLVGGDLQSVSRSPALPNSVSAAFLSLIAAAQTARILCSAQFLTQVREFWAIKFRMHRRRAKLRLVQRLARVLRQGIALNAEEDDRDAEARPELDLGLAAGRQRLLGDARQAHRPAQPDLVDRRRTYRLLGLADLEHRHHQA